MAYCPQCGANVGDANVCPQCGAMTSVSSAANNNASNPFAAGSQSENSGYVASGDAPKIPGFVDAFKICWSKTFNVSGRASRSEYWFFVLWNFLIGLGAGVILVSLGGSDLAEHPENISGGAAFVLLLVRIYDFCVFFPAICALIRRLHDIGKSGWNLLFIFLPLVGPIILLLFAIRRPQEGANEFGPQPR